MKLIETPNIYFDIRTDSFDKFFAYFYPFVFRRIEQLKFSAYLFIVF